jgi:hypothetical protein
MFYPRHVRSFNKRKLKPKPPCLAESITERHTRMALTTEIWIRAFWIVRSDRPIWCRNSSRTQQRKKRAEVCLRDPTSKRRNRGRSVPPQQQRKQRQLNRSIDRKKEKRQAASTRTIDFGRETEMRRVVRNDSESLVVCE